MVGTLPDAFASGALPALSLRLLLHLQGALQKLQPVLAPEDLARRQHEARRAEYACGHRLLGELIMQRAELGVRRRVGAQRSRVKAGALSGQRDCLRIGERFLALPQGAAEL